MVTRLERGDIAALISVVTLEMERRSEGGDGASSYCRRLTGIRDKLLAVLADKEASLSGSDSSLPEFREYARRKYQTELNEDLITMIEDLIEMRRQGSGRGIAQPGDDETK